MAVVSKVRNPVRALRSKATRAARCHSTSVCQSVASTSRTARAFAVVNLGLIQKFIDEGKIDAKAEITEDALIASGLVRRKKDGIRVLAKGDFTAKVNIDVTGASKGAVEAVEKAGGSLTVTTPVSGRVTPCERRKRRLHMFPSFPKRRQPGNRRAAFYMKRDPNGFCSRANGGQR